MNLIRKIKINKITSVEFTEKELKIIEFINSMLSDLIPFQYENLPESMFYMNPAGKWILEQNDKSDILYVRLENFWRILETDYSMGYDDIQTLLKYMIEQAFKEKVSTPRAWLRKGTGRTGRIEEAFKKKISAPIEQLVPPTIEVEQAFKHIDNM